MAISLAASRYLVTIDGDMTSELPVLVKPSPAAPSAGNSRAGSRVWTPVRSRTVKVYSALFNRRRTTGPGSPARASAAVRSAPRTHVNSRSRSGAEGCGIALGGISPSDTCSITFSHTLGVFSTSAVAANRSRFRSPAWRAAEWQPRQYCFSSGCSSRAKASCAGSTAGSRQSSAGIANRRRVIMSAPILCQRLRERNANFWPHGRGGPGRPFPGNYALTVWNSHPLRKVGFRSLLASLLLVIRILSGSYSSLPS